MSKIILSIIAISVFLFSGCKSGSKKKEALKGEITIATSENTGALIENITAEFKKNYPNVKIDVIIMDADVYVESALLNEMVNIGVISANSVQSEPDRKINSFCFARDAVVGIVSADNPVIENLLNRGIKKSELVNIYSGGNIVNWGSFGNSKSKDIVNAYFRRDECPAAETWAGYLGKKITDLKGTKVISGSNMLSAIEKDKNGIGYVNFNLAYASSSKYEKEGIKIIPIDKNENGILDDNENFTFRKDSIMKAIFREKYPRELTEHILITIKKGKTDNVTSELIKWMLTDGQAFVNDAGFVKVSDNKIKESLNKLKNIK
ncbi:MAG: substrate-binding domain-containing protein [Bacteroidales bacterium]|nr:substrate-binding domain-containing protein [Bacteroidales bacterium]